MSKVAQQGIKPSSELKPQLLTIKRHRLLQKGSPQFPAGLTSTMHTSYLGRPPQNLLPPRFGFQTSPTAQKSPRAVGQPLLPARSPAPPVERSARPPARARWVTAPPFPHPARTVQPWGAAPAPLAGPVGAYPARGPLGHPPAAVPCPLDGSPALSGTASTARARLRFRLRLVQTARPRPPTR